jgi:hypothetical protein
MTRHACRLTIRYGAFSCSGAGIPCCLFTLAELSIQLPTVQTSVLLQYILRVSFCSILIFQLDAMYHIFDSIGAVSLLLVRSDLRKHLI